MLLYVEYNIIFVSVVCNVVDSVSSKQQQWNLNRSSTEVHWLCWMCAVRSLWLHRLPDQPQAHDFFSKQRLLVRSMWNYVESDQGATLFDREGLLRIHSHTCIRQILKWCYPEQPKNSSDETFGHLRATTSYGSPSSKKAPSSISKIHCYLYMFSSRPAASPWWTPR